jgi:hypothetical protein
MYKEFHPDEKVVAITEHDGQLIVATERAIYRLDKEKGCIVPVSIAQDTREADLSMGSAEFWHEIKRQIKSFPADADLVVRVAERGE